MPIHNEYNMLQYSLEPMFSLEPDEIVVLFDRCTDRSKELVVAIAKKVKYTGNLKLIDINNLPPDWKYHVAKLYRDGFTIARNDVILTMAGDVILDKRIPNYIKEIENTNTKFISFGSKFYPANMVYFTKRLISLVFPERGFGGIFLFSKKAWMETEDQNEVKKLPKGQDTFLQLAIKKKYLTRHVWLNVLDLRVRVDKEDQYMRGVLAHQILHKSLLDVLFSTIVYLSPYMLIGYLRSKKL
jgi:glycosyltransferase involved in cell wall biosynthesis